MTTDTDHQNLLARLQEDFRRWAAKDGPYLAVATIDFTGDVIAVSLRGRVEWNALIHTTQPIADGAQRVHGLSAGHLRNALSPAVALTELARVTRGLEVLVFNLPFVREALNRTTDRAGLPPIHTDRWRCVQAASAPFSSVPAQGDGLYPLISLPAALQAARARSDADIRRGTTDGNARLLQALVEARAARHPNPLEDLPEEDALDSLHREVARRAGVAYVPRDR